MLKLKIKDDSIKISFKGNVTGIIYLQYDNFIFPEENWNDFIVILLTDWSKKLINLASKGTSEEVFRFMDGPFFFHIYSLDKIHEIEFCHSNSTIKRVSFNFMSFVIEFISVLNKIFPKIKNENINIKELDLINKNLKILQKYI